jgi:hypothetical protein
MLRGVKKLNFKFMLTMAIYDRIKLPRLRSNRLNDSRPPKKATSARSRLVNNAKPRIRHYLSCIQQPARSCARKIG